MLTTSVITEKHMKISSVENGKGRGKEAEKKNVEKSIVWD